MSSLNEYMTRATIQERLRRADELRAGRADWQVSVARRRSRRVRRAAMLMALMRGSRWGDDVVVPANGGHTLANQHDQRVTTGDGDVEHAVDDAAVNGAADTDQLVQARW